jgi:small conductance mechanosensitive channel
MQPKHIDYTAMVSSWSANLLPHLALAVVAVLGNLGVQTASLLAVLGAAGLAIGLPLQGTLTNIAAGIMLLWLRPFHVGDYIEVPSNNISGTVKEIGLFACQLENFDGIFVLLPTARYGIQRCAITVATRAGSSASPSLCPVRPRRTRRVKFSSR